MEILWQSYNRICYYGSLAYSNGFRSDQSLNVFAFPINAVSQTNTNWRTCEWRFVWELMFVYSQQNCCGAVSQSLAAARMNAWWARSCLLCTINQVATNACTANSSKVASLSVPYMHGHGSHVQGFKLARVPCSKHRMFRHNHACNQSPPVGSRIDGT